MRSRGRFRGSTNWSRRWRTRWGAAALAAAVAVPALAACGTNWEQGVINIFTPADGVVSVTTIANKCAAESNGAYRVNVTTLPRGADDQRLQLARRLAGNDAGLDVMGMDVIWTAEFAEAGWLAPVPDGLAETTARENLAGPVETAMWRKTGEDEARMWAVPIWTNTQLLWFRPDLQKAATGSTEAPATWDQMLVDTAAIRADGGPSWIMVQARQYEGLMVWFNSLLQSAGGNILDPDDPSKQTLNDTPEHREATLTALRTMHAVANAPGADPSISNSDETTARLGMETGNAAYQINWPFVFASARDNGAAGVVPFLADLMPQHRGALSSMATPPTREELEQLEPINDKLRERFNFAEYPGIAGHGPAKSTLGGLNMAVASTSKQSDLAFQVVQCLTKKESQEFYAIDAAQPPTNAAAYDDETFKLAYPMGDLIKTQLTAERVAPRPASPQYQAISTLVTHTLSPVGRWNPDDLVDKLAENVQRAIDGEGIIP